MGRSVGLDKAKCKVYVMIAGLYYKMIFHYATQLWEDFGASISHTNVAIGVSCAIF